MMLHSLDLVIIAVYLFGVVCVGIACKGKQDDVGDYFTTRGRMGSVFGSVLVGLSIAATLFSGISFLGYPSIVFQHGIAILFGMVCFPVAWVVLRLWFLPRYLKGRFLEPYSIIEREFGLGVRMVAAGMFALLRIGWMSALIYAPTMALMAAGGLGEEWFWPLVITIGLSSTIYTALGGIRGVIVTDAIQFVIIAVGVAFAIAYGLSNLPVPLGEAVAGLRRRGLLSAPSFSLDLSETMTFWAITIGMITANLSSYMADQMSLQRYLATNDVRSTSRSFIINIVGASTVLVMLAGIGLTLSAWYFYMPDPNLPTQADKIFPYYVATQLPVGVAGILLAAILAATMSSMTSGINALAGTITLDFRARLFGKMTPKQELRFARIASVVVGILSTLVAGVVQHLGNIFSMSQKLLGVFLGPLLMCIILAVWGKRMHNSSVLVGLVCGAAVGWVVAFSQASPLWTSPFAFASALTVAFVGTLIFGPSPKLGHGTSP